MEVRKRIQAVLRSRWFLPSWGVFWGASLVGTTVYVPMTGVGRDIYMFAAGGLIGFAVVGVTLRLDMERHARRTVEKMMSPEHFEQIERQMVDAGQRAIARMRAYNPDMRIEGGYGQGPDDGDGGVRH